MKLHIFGKHPIPQGGFNGVMSLFEAIEFSRLGYEVTLLIPFQDKGDFSDFLETHDLGSLNDLPRFGGHFDIVPVFPDGEGFSRCEVLVYQSYFQQDWDLFAEQCRSHARLMTKNFPKFVPAADSAFEPYVYGQFQQFDLVACALSEDVSLLASNVEFARELGGAFVYAPRGASPTLLHPGYKSGLPPTIGLDVPNTSDPKAVEHYFEPIHRLRHEFPDLQVLSIGRELSEIESIKVPFGRFDRIYEGFFNRIHVYCVINYQYSPAHLQARVQKEARGWQHRAIYEVQNIEAQMSGAVLFGHRSNLISELYQPGISGLNISEFEDSDAIYQTLRLALLRRTEFAIGARQFAERNFSWSHCIGLWSNGIQARMGALESGSKRISAAPPAPKGDEGVQTEGTAVAEEEELSVLIRLGRKYKWATGEVRNRLERSGVNLVRSDFYSDAPTLAEIEESFEYAGSSGPNDTPAVFGDSKIFDRERIAAYAESLVPFGVEFNPEDDASANDFFWKNSQFTGTDAIALYAVIRRERPRTVLEIGSGYSTRVAREALSAVGSDRRLICIDPEPRADISGLSDIRFIKMPLQQVGLEVLAQEVKAGDVVFYDGSHALKTGSDTVYFYLCVLPYLPVGTLVHVHDLRLPYPRNKKALTHAKLYWGEQYLAMAHLHNIHRYEVFFASNLLHRERPDVLERLMAGKAPAGGVSLWFRICGD